MSEEIKSLTGKIWVIRNPSQSYYGYSPILSRLLINRNISQIEIEDFINPTLKKTLPDPYVLKEMQKSVEKVAEWIINQEKIVIIGDYDVDGVTSVSLLINYFKAIGYTNFEYYIPHRIKDGYGINKHIVERFKNERNLITVDNGSTAYEALDLAKSYNMSVIILDHHEIPVISPNAFAIVNAHRADDTSGLTNLCAAGVTFFFLIALNRYLRTNLFFSEKKIIEPKLADFLDIVALGTVCDVMPLTGVNRAIVRAGLTKITNTKNLGLQKLLNIADSKADSKKEITTETLGYFIGPRLNAAGRLDDATLSVQLLTTQQTEQARLLVDKLNKLNLERQAIETTALKDIAPVLDTENFILAYGSNWHIGVIGIIAGRLKEQYNIPAFVVSFDENGLGHGSARSIPEYDLAEIIATAKQNNILEGGGGHKLAGGFTIRKDHIAEFKNFLTNKITGPRIPHKIITDGYVSLMSITLDLLNEINSLAPFGQCNEKPNFVIPNVRIAYYNLIGQDKKHISLVLEDEFGYNMRAIAFNAANTALEGAIKRKNLLYNILGSFIINNWNNKTDINIIVEDISIAK